MYSVVHDLIIDDRELRVYANGTGAPLLMLHDLGDSATVFEPLTGPICLTRHELVAVDLPGFGRSDPPPAPGLAGILEVLAAALPRITEREGDRLDLAGHGLGGYLALSLAARMPSMIRAVLVLEPTVPPRSGGRVAARMPLGMAVNGAVTTLRRGKLRQNLGGLGRARSVLGDLATADPAWWSALSWITARTLVISHGTAGIGERAVADQVAAAVPGARRADLERAGHRPQVEAPAALARVMLDFLDE